MQKLEQLILPFMLLSMFAIKAGTAVECYICVSSENDECLDVSKSASLKPEVCKLTSINKPGKEIWLEEITKIDYFETSEPNVPMVCQKITAKNENDKEIVYRGCQLHGGKTNTCERVTSKAAKSKVTIVDCGECSEDGCNKSLSIKAFSFWLLLVPVILIKAFI